MSLYNAAVKPNDYNARLSEFVSQLFNALAQMVQSKVIQDADTLGITLGAIFELVYKSAVRRKDCQHRLALLP